jgi:adenosylcobinamide-GDP ribazoletransferase
MEFLLALQFLTRAPITIHSPVEEKNLARSMAYFPLVGVLLGLLTTALYALLTRVLSGPVCDLIAIAFLVIITGNLHGDAFMDTADGIFSGRPRERILEIMKDSRVGSHGVMAGCLLILAKFVLLGQIPSAAKGTALILMLVLGRWAQVYGATVYTYARTGGGIGSFTDQVGIRELFWASVTAMLAVILMLALYMSGQDISILPGIIEKGLILLGTVVVGTACLGWYISRKIGGMTGDTLGAISESIEVLALLILPIILG